MQDLAKGIVGRFTVEGRPRTKGSLKVITPRGRKPILAEDHAHSAPWRKKMRLAIIAQCGPTLTYYGPVAVTAVYMFARENGADGYLKPSHLDDFPTAPEFGDLDKLDRNLLDALTESKLIDDDRQVVRIVSEKRFAPLGGTAGIEVHVLTVENIEPYELSRGDFISWLEKTNGNHA